MGLRSVIGKKLKATGRLMKRRVKNKGREIANDFSRGERNKRVQTLFRKPGLRTIGKSLGIFGKGASAGSDTDYTLPPLERPERVTNKAGPELSTIEQQLAELAKVVFKIAIAMNKQQDTLINQVKQKERASSEALLERPAQLENNSGSGDLTPLGDTFSSLIQKINELTGVIDEKINNGESSGGSGGLLGDAADLLDGNGRRGKKASRAAKAVKKPGLVSRGVSGIGRAAGAVGRGALGIGRAAGAAAAGALSKGGLISRGVSGIASMAKFGAGKLAGMFGSTVKKVAPNASKVIGPAAIKKLAGPIVGKALGKTALKSIPIIGAVAGLGFAVSRLVDGDVVGASIDAASGLAGPFTAIPALIASVARDVYTGAYGIPPEQDPQAGERMSMVTGAVKDLVAAEIKDKVEVKEPASGKKYEPNLPAIKPIPTQKKQGGKEPKIPAVSKPSPSSMGPQNSADSSDVSQKVGFDVNNPSSMNSADSSDVSQKVGFDVNNPSANKSDAPEIPPSPKPEAGYDERSIEPEPNKANTGTDIQKASMENETLANSEVPNIQTAKNELPQPSKDITSRSGATGIGNVPDPTYGNMGSIAQQLYFGAAV